MKCKAEDLIFINQISRDGLELIKVTDKTLKHMKENRFAREEIFELNTLSLTEETFIASGFNSYIVKLKNK